MRGWGGEKEGKISCTLDATDDDGATKSGGRAPSCPANRAPSGATSSGGRRGWGIKQGSDCWDYGGGGHQRKGGGEQLHRCVGKEGLERSLVVRVGRAKEGVR